MTAGTYTIPVPTTTVAAHSAAIQYNMITGLFQPNYGEQQSDQGHQLKQWDLERDTA